MAADLASRVLAFTAACPELPKPADVLALEPSLSALDLGRALLDVFAQQNFLGPPEETLTAAVGALPEEKVRAVSEELTRDGEAPFRLADGLVLLSLARQLLHLSHKEKPCKSSLLWSMKAIDVHQTLLDEKSPSLRQEFLSLLDGAGHLMSLPSPSDAEWLDVALRLEAMSLAIFYFEHRRAKALMEEARGLATVEAELSGAPGKRTRFQKEEKTQLFLLLHSRQNADNSQGDADNSQQNADNSQGDTDNSQQSADNSQGDADSSGSISGVGLPMDVPLDDDTLLPKIQFSGEAAVAPVRMSAEESAFVLALAVFHRHSHPLTAVTQEEVLAYLQALMAQPADWGVLSEALVLRSQLERHSGRRLQRAIQQMEELGAQFNRRTPSFASRARLFAVSRMPPHWDLQKEYAELLLAEGMSKSALAIFLRWEAWPDVINCYLRLGESGSAERVIRSRLEAEPLSVPLLCALGDVTGTRQPYEQAWEASKQRSARAMRSLGFLLCRSGDYEEAVGCLEKSLTLNPLHHGTAFAMGCACLQNEDFDRAETAFRRCTAMEPDDFQAWANLSAVLARKKQKDKALAILEEAIKHNYENWRLWENYLAVGTDCGAFSGVIDALQRLAELHGGRHWDPAVFRVLVRAVNEDLPDRHGRPASALRPRLAELFGRHTAQGGNEPEAWRLYSDLLRGEAPSVAELSAESRRKAAQFAQRAVTARMERPEARGWESDERQCGEIAAELASVMRLGMECAAIDPDCKAVLRSCRFSARSLRSHLKKHHTDLLTGEIVDSLKSSAAELDDLYQEVDRVLAN